MTISRVTFACLTCVIVGACAAPTPLPTAKITKVGGTEAEFNKDRAQCLYEVERAFAGYGSSAPVPATMGAAIAQGAFEGVDLNQKKQALAVSCMEARGYTRRQ